MSIKLECVEYVIDLSVCHHCNETAGEANERLTIVIFLPKRLKYKPASL